ncbi:Y+L amino acid transporter 2 [Aplysia californica]|uniref:Y+L amino acid transporter 2 n=1 Tax=Aplysia californica TaxID=6500 RepID=A0ABM0JL83_APLCA|nr:Y+L amino acid transporter 2 [Aplysia californica]
MTEPADTETREMSDVAAESHDVTIETKVQMKKELGIPGAVSMVVGNVIGSGIFISPKGVLRASGSIGLSMVVWLIAGFLQLGSALCFAEMGTMIPQSGGAYTYIRKGLGNFFAFFIMFKGVIIHSPASKVVILMTCSKYLVTLLPTCGSPRVVEKVITATLMLTLGIVNTYSTRYSARIMIVTTVAKVSALVVIIIGGFIVISQGTVSELGSGFQGTSQDPSALALAIYSASFAYSGSESVNSVVEEIKRPSRTLPLAAIFGVIAVMAIYLLTNISYLAVMSRAELLQADAVAVLWGDRVLGKMAVIIPITVVISTLGSANTSVYHSSRISFAAARDGNIPDALSYLQVGTLTPLCAMIVDMTLALVMLIPADIGTFINYMGFLNSVSDALVFIAFIVFRFGSMRNAHRPVKVPILIAVLMVLVSVYLFIAPLALSPKMSYVYVTAIVLGTTLLVYVPFVACGINVPLYDRVVTWVQLTLNVCPPAKFTD